jgi:multicomponent Na+:H+ antiporter subunit E
MHTIIPLVVLVFTYLALSANLQLSNLMLGVLIAIGILSLLRFPRRAVKWSRLPLALMALVIFFGMLLHNVIRSGIHVGLLVLNPKMPIKSGIVKIPAACESELGQAINAHTITLAPGELFVEMDQDGCMYIHSLNVDLTEKQAEASQRFQGALLKRIFD